MREQRKVVTVLFADVVGSTSLASESDPEVVRATMSRYFGRVTQVAEAYGGTVEKFAGDSVMVVFGVPMAHDDDAERAVRAAIEIRDGSSDLAVRIGVNTGEAVTAARDDRQQLVSGDTVNVAARLQQGADPGEVVVGLLTQRMTRSAIEYAPREPVLAKGKAEPLAAYRALRPGSAVPSQTRGIPGLHSALVGREREMRLLLDTYARVVPEKRLHLFTLVGAPGVGKSRLVDEALEIIAQEGGRVVRGRCLPYGHGITYWPLIEIVRHDTGIALGDERAVALEKLDRWLSDLLAADPERPALRARLAVMMGLEQPAAAMPDMPAERVQREIAWAMRRYVEAVALSAPVVLVVDDLQWAESPILEILGQLADRLTNVPAMLVCIARPEFLEQHPGWGAGKANTTTMSLEPLSAAETGILISQLLEVDAVPAGLRAQIVERSAGTPLFCEELIRMLVDEGRLVSDGERWRATTQLEEIPVPPSINAVLAARLDGLPEGDRAVLQAASVIGQQFRPNQVAALFGGADVDGYLDSLRRRGLVAGDDRPDSEMRFSHLLVRDAAYASLTKSERASLHDRFGVALESEVHDVHPVAEILAHHAERAFSLSRELQLDGEAMDARSGRALRWSLELADRAAARHDLPVIDAALKTARSAGDALPAGGGEEAQARLALLEAQRAVIVGDYRAAERFATRAAAIAEAAGLDQQLAAARLTDAWIWTWAGEGRVDELDVRVRRAIEACTRAGDREGTIEARFIGTNVQWALGRLDEFASALEALAAEARSIGDRRHLARILMRLAIAESVRGRRDAAASVWKEVYAIASDLGLRDIILRYAYQQADERWASGDAETGERLMRAYLAEATEAGAGLLILLGLRFLSWYLMRGGRFADAIPVLDQAIELSLTTGERWNRAELYAFRAETALSAGDVAGAERFVGEATAMLRSEDDVSAVAVAYRALGLVRAAQGRDAEAEAALRKARTTAAATTYGVDRIESDIALARFLAARGGHAEARGYLDEARRLATEARWKLWDAQMQSVEGELQLITPP